jgi:hypothetical protein
MNFPGSAFPALKHPASYKTWHPLACSHDPHGSYHNGLFVSCDRNVNAPALPKMVRRKLRPIPFANCLKQDRAEPCGVAAPNAQRLPENSGLVPTAWMRRIQAIILELADIEDCLRAIRQRRHAELPSQTGAQYLFAIGSSSAGNRVITRQPLSVTTTSSSMRAAE